jgi:glycosyltransferase 2 family protein
MSRYPRRVPRQHSMLERARTLVTPARLRVARLIFFGVAIGLSVYAIATRWDEVSTHLGQIGWERALACVPLMLGGLFCGMRAWRAVIGGLGSELPVREASRIYFVGQLGKYVPGSVWPVIAQMELGHDHEVPRRRSAGALVVAIVVSLSTGVIITAITVPFVDGSRYPALWWLLVPVPFLLALLDPRVLWGCLRRLPLLRLHTNLPAPPPNRAMAKAVAWSTLGWLSYGAHVAVLAAAFHLHSVAILLVASVGGYALAWATGLIAFVLPAGAGARDVTLVLALAAVLPTNPAIAVAVVSRAVTTVCDLALAGVAAIGVAPRLRERAAERALQPAGQQVVHRH